MKPDDVVARCHRIPQGLKPSAFKSAWFVFDMFNTFVQLFFY